MKKKFGEKLTEIRGTKKRSEMAAFFGVSITAYSNWERGDKEPNLETVSLICTHFNKSANWLLGLPEKQSSPTEPIKLCTECKKKDEIITNLSQTLKNVTDTKKDTTTKPITPSSIQTAKH